MIDNMGIDHCHDIVHDWGVVVYGRRSFYQARMKWKRRRRKVVVVVGKL